GAGGDGARRGGGRGSDPRLAALERDGSERRAAPRRLGDAAGADAAPGGITAAGGGRPVGTAWPSRAGAIFRRREGGSTFGSCPRPTAPSTSTTTRPRRWTPACLPPCGRGG